MLGFARTANGPSNHTGVSGPLQVIQSRFNPLNAQLNLICHLLALLGAHPILHVSRIKVNVSYYLPLLSNESIVYVALCLLIYASVFIMCEDRLY
jgi:hypothetical protein